ncbi:hypothetical protein U1Q18_005103 [Sarracenia purpurea var. burkii]
MVRLSNGFVAFLNIASLLVSLAAIGGSVWFSTNRNHGASDCEKVLQRPLLIVGLSLLVVSLLGLIGSCCRIQLALWIYLIVMFFLIVAMACFTVFAVAITNKGVGKAVSGRGYKEYRLGDYSNWLQKYVVNEKNWGKIRSCLVDSNVCSGIGGNRPESAADFNKRNLSPIQSGCCKPPTSCGFEFKNATFWAVPRTGSAAAADTDCTAWSNRQEVLCYGCKSCRAGVLANIKKEWRLLAIVNVGLLMFLILIYSAACCARRNNRSSGYNRYKSGYP